MNHHHHQNHPPSSLPSNPNPEPDPSLPCNGYHKISLPLLRRCMSDPCNPPSATASNPLFFDPSLSSASRCGGSLPNFTPPYSPDRHHCPKTPSHSPTHALPPLPPPHTFRHSVSDINPSPAKASSRFSTSSQDLGTDIDTPNSKRLRRMKDRLREMSHWCQQLMREEDLMEEDEDEQQQAVEEEAQVQAVDATDQDFHNNTGAAELTFSLAMSREFRPYKLDPAPLLHICSAWEVKPSEIMMVGDSLKDDVACGKRAGAVACLLVESGRYDSPEYANVDFKPDFKVSSLMEVHSLLEAHFDLSP